MQELAKLEVLTRVEEIKKEIWQISESYTNLSSGKMYYNLTERERKHCAFLYARLTELIMQLNNVNKSFEIKTNLVYKKMVNNLRDSLWTSTSQEYKDEVLNSEDIKTEHLI